MNIFVATSLLIFFSFSNPAQKVTPSVKLGAYYFEAWSGKCPYDDGKPEHAWAKGMPTHATKTLVTQFAGRMPLWGWRDDAPGVMEQQIDLAADNGLAFFSFCWYWEDNNGPINIPLLESLPRNHGLQMFLDAKNNDRMEFCLMVANFNNWNIVGTEAWKQATDYWIKLFKHPSYLLTNAKPLLMIYNYQEIDPDGLTYLQDAARKAGFPGVEIAARGGGPDDGINLRVYYSYSSGPKKKVEKRKYQELVDASLERWKGTAEQPVIPLLVQGRDRRPWIPKNDEGLGWLNHDWGNEWYYEKATPKEFKGYLVKLLEWINTHPEQVTKDRLAIIYAWNEIAEGGWLMPCLDDPEGEYLKAIKQVVTGK